MNLAVLSGYNDHLTAEISLHPVWPSPWRAGRGCRACTKHRPTQCWLSRPVDDSVSRWFCQITPITCDGYAVTSICRSGQDHVKVRQNSQELPLPYTIS